MADFTGISTDELIRYLQEPSILREEAAALVSAKLIVIDEIQKSPMLLDEIHYLIEKH